MSFLTDPVVALFLSLALGHLLGRIRVGPVVLGGVCGTLFVALALGQLGIRIPDELKNAAFALFIYALGFTAGPQFFANIHGGARYAVFPVIEITVSLGLTLLAVWFFRLDAGMAAGLFAGSATESAVLGTASEAITRLPLPEEEVRLLQAHLGTAYSLTYLFGLVAIVVFVTQVAPMIARKNLQQQAQALSATMGEDEDAPMGQPLIVERAFEVGSLVGQTARQFEQTRNWTVVIKGVQRGDEFLHPDLDFVLQPGDVIFIRGRRNTVIAARNVLGHEVPVPADASLSAISRDVVLSRKEAFGQEAQDLRDLVDPALQRGIFITAIRRMGHAVPPLPRTRLQEGDVLTIYGPDEAVDRATRELGHALVGDKTDFVILGLGIVFGLAIGHLALPIGSMVMTLGTGGGALVSGLIFGWLNTRFPSHGAMPGAAASFAKEFGLAAFIAAIGLGAGPDAIALIREYGLLFPALGVLLSVTPAIVSLLVGMWWLRVPLPVLLGAIAGQHCSTPAISALVTQAGNATPVIGYTVTYAIANVLLPFMGPAVVALAVAMAG